MVLKQLLVWLLEVRHSGSSGWQDTDRHRVKGQIAEILIFGRHPFASVSLRSYNPYRVWSNTPCEPGSRVAWERRVCCHQSQLLGQLSSILCKYSNLKTIYWCIFYIITHIQSEDNSIRLLCDQTWFLDVNIDEQYYSISKQSGFPYVSVASVSIMELIVMTLVWFDVAASLTLPLPSPVTGDGTANHVLQW